MYIYADKQALSADCVQGFVIPERLENCYVLPSSRFVQHIVRIHVFNVCMYVCMCILRFILSHSVYPETLVWRIYVSFLGRRIYSEDHFFTGDILPVYGGSGARNALLGATHTAEAIPLAR